MLAVFGFKHLYSDDGCKVLLYLARTSRGMAICVTSILVCIQCIILSPTTSRLFVLKRKLTQYTIIAFFFILLLNMLTEVSPLIHTVSILNSTDLEYTFYFGYCAITFSDYLTFMATTFSLFVRDFIFVFLMMTVSATIVLMLFMHNKQVTNIRSDLRTRSKNTAEIRAAKVVVILASLYIIFVGFENTIFLYQISISKRIHPLVSDVRHFFSVCYASVFPTVVIISNKKVKTYLKCWY
ncbi:olfactory receptor class A-like protein 1 [Protopterus annectens]|uniref:olfactory receptor class A-like protein 1 n=1 Tax=Protopterus annectens TaxID=7888 RepID=UPI001CFB5821|nr:olfactory receptor class A-like protein 1 [Protopterus annectens]